MASEYTTDDLVRDILQDRISVMPPGHWENDLSKDSIIKDWYAVVTDDEGIIAYFMDEEQALSFRSSYINSLLEPKKRR